MTKITIYASYWEDFMVFAPEAEDEDFFRSLGPLEMEVIDHTVVVAPGMCGNKPIKINPERNAGRTCTYKWQYKCPKGWARYMMHAIEVDIKPDGSFIWEMPLDHELPWPQLNHYPKGDHTAVAEREFELRLRSAFDHNGTAGLRALMRTIPSTFRSCISTKAWMAITARVQHRETEPCT